MSIFKQILQPRPAGPGDPELPAVAEEPETHPALEDGDTQWRRRILSGLWRVLHALRLVPELAVLGAGAGMLDFWVLKRNGFANVYYAAAVRSMARNWHNFWYASFDPNGVMSIDKSPLAVWIQALSVRIFGFHSESILIPEAVIGVITVLVLYDLVRRCFGRIAGFVAGAALATTPITVAMSRHNNPDALVTLCCVAALWFLVRALKDGKTRWIVLSGVMVGLGFETKWGLRSSSCRGSSSRGCGCARRLASHARSARDRRCRDDARRGRLAAFDRVHAGRPATVDRRHRRQQHPVADLRLQRLRPGRRPAGRPSSTLGSSSDHRARCAC